MAESPSKKPQRPPPDLLDARVRLPEHVVHRSFVSETVVLNIQTGQYHGLNPVAGQMLATLERLPDVRSAARHLAAEFDEPLERIESDITMFCADLLSRGLIEMDDAEAA